MSTLEDFENAHFGATATQEETRARAFRLHREFGETWVVAERDGTFDTFESEELVDGGFILDPLPSQPTSARGALELAWELAYPVNEEQTIPKGTDYLVRYVGEGLARRDKAWEDISPRSAPQASWFRTLDPLPDPEPDWLDAPAVLAHLDNPIFQQKAVFIPVHEEEGRWVAMFSALTFHWSELEDVTPLYPKGQDA